MAVRLINDDCRTALKSLEDGSVNCVVTSPPYFGLRDYGMDGQIGLEQTPDEYVAEMVAVFRDVRRVLRDDGTLWLNLGDSYASGGRKTRDADRKLPQRGVDFRAQDGLASKQLIGIPWRVAFALQADGWYLRQDIIWHKPNPMPESVRDRCTKAHEYVFLLSKSGRYFYDTAAIAEPLARPEEADRKTPAVFGGRDKHVETGKQSRLHSGNEYKGTDTGTRNRRSVWTIGLQPFTEAHFATMAPELAETCIKAGSKPGDTILDPFGGAGTTGLCADRLNRNAVLIELNPEYVEIARKRVTSDAGMFAEVAA